MQLFMLKSANVSPLYTTLIVSTMIVCVCNPDFVETYLLFLKVKHTTKAYIVYTHLVYKIIIYTRKQMGHSIRSNKLTNERNVIFQSQQRFYCNFLTNVSSVTWNLRTLC